MFRLVLAVFFTLLFLGWAADRTICGISFNQKIEGFLDRSAHANTIDLAYQNLDSALKNIEARGINPNSGFTSIVWNTPDEDVGYWYNNLNAALNELKKINPNSSQLEKTNVLLKLKETLLSDRGEVLSPSGISIYPDNLLFSLWGWLSLILALIFWIWIAIVEG